MEEGTIRRERESNGIVYYNNMKSSLHFLGKSLRVLWKLLGDCHNMYCFCQEISVSQSLGVCENILVFHSNNKLNKDLILVNAYIVSIPSQL